ncbi:hypothetical protein BDY24DRAFT_339959 [Mrakia frigida]|uniref:uncharacterized protein n=1 Tax=Mrakia frigida TaxID=29902 RepID=UPI003FCC0EF5
MHHTGGVIGAPQRKPRLVKTSRVPAPIPVPHLNKRSRGRHVPIDPKVVRTKKGGNGRVYECMVTECGKCFGRSEHLKRHIRSLHTNEKPFPCPHPTCTKEFSRHDNLFVSPFLFSLVSTNCPFLLSFLFLTNC